MSRMVDQYPVQGFQSSAGALQAEQGGGPVEQRAQDIGLGRQGFIGRLQGLGMPAQRRQDGAAIDQRIGIPRPQRQCLIECQQGRLLLAQTQ